MTVLYNQLANGNMTQAVYGLYDTLIPGHAGFGVFTLWVVLQVLIYLTTQDINLPFSVGILTGILLLMTLTIDTYFQGFMIAILLFELASIIVKFIAD